MIDQMATASPLIIAAVVEMTIDLIQSQHAAKLVLLIHRSVSRFLFVFLSFIFHFWFFTFTNVIVCEKIA